MDLLRGPLLRSMVTILGLTLGACSVGEVEGLTPDGPVNQTNVTSFSAQISPLVTRCTGCHGTTQDPNLTSFTTLKPKYYTKPGSANILVNKGDHEGVTYFSATEKASVTSWIDGVVP